MRLVVTGAAGFIGSSLTDALLAEGHEVVGLDAFINYYAREVKEANLAGARDHETFAFHEADLRSAPLDPLLDGADAVVHLAAMPGLVRSWSDVELYATCNLLATHRLIEAALACRVPRFIHASTSSVYGLLAVGDETAPTRPISPYGVTKLAAEHLIQAFVATRGLNASILRYFSIYGPRQRPDMAYHLFAEAMLDGRPITVTGDGHQTRSNTFVHDCVQATMAAIDGAATGEVYNIAGGEEISLNDAIAAIGEALGTTPRIEHAPARPGDQLRTSADTSRASAAFGFRPTTSVRDGLAAQVAWHVGRRRRGRRGSAAAG
jgi:nucleoside-diphosphate-sugar epimerase